MSDFLSACSIAPGSYLSFSPKDAQTDADILNSQVSVTTVDARVIRTSAKESDDSTGLLAALESERGRTSTGSDRATSCRSSCTTTPSSPSPRASNERADSG